MAIVLAQTLIWVAAVAFLFATLWEQIRDVRVRLVTIVAIGAVLIETRWMFWQTLVLTESMSNSLVLADRVDQVVRRAGQRQARAGRVPHRRLDAAARLERRHDDGGPRPARRRRACGSVDARRPGSVDWSRRPSSSSWWGRCR
ncbi:MAG: hypothetical protein R2697_04750 [Ilumatobacteraceae bacterium]